MLFRVFQVETFAKKYNAKYKSTTRPPPAFSKRRPYSQSSWTKDGNRAPMIKVNVTDGSLSLLGGDAC
jgi:hypothetical protein